MKLKHAAVVAGVGVAMAAAIAPAMATGAAVKVSVGGSTAAGNHPITAASTGALTFAVPTLTMNCTSAAVPASPVSTVTSGTSVTNIASINKVNFTGCSGPGGALAVTTSGTWLLHANTTSNGVTSGSSDVINGHLENITANVSNSVCKFTVTGSAAGTYNEATKQLKVNQTGFISSPTSLTVSNVTGCLGQVTNGQKANFTGTFNVTSPDGVILVG